MMMEVVKKSIFRTFGILGSQNFGSKRNHLPLLTVAIHNRLLHSKLNTMVTRLYMQSSKQNKSYQTQIDNVHVMQGTLINYRAASIPDDVYSLQHLEEISVKYLRNQKIRANLHSLRQIPKPQLPSKYSMISSPKMFIL